MPVFRLLRGRFSVFSPRKSNTLHRWWWNLALRSVARFLLNFQNLLAVPSPIHIFNLVGFAQWLLRVTEGRRYGTVRDVTTSGDYINGTYRVPRSPSLTSLPLPLFSFHFFSTSHPLPFCWLSPIPFSLFSSSSPSLPHPFPHPFQIYFTFACQFSSILFRVFGWHNGCPDASHLRSRLHISIPRYSNHVSISYRFRNVAVGEVVNFSDTQYPPHYCLMFPMRVSSLLECRQSRWCRNRVTAIISAAENRLMRVVKLFVSTQHEWIWKRTD